MKPVLQKVLVGVTPPIVMAAYHRMHKQLQKKISSTRISKYSRLHLACGWNILQGWANIDTLNNRNLIHWNLLNPLPIEDNSIEYIFCEHYLEHIDRMQAKAFMTDCHRVLKEGGVIRISTPSLRKIIDDYIKGHKLGCTEIDATASTPCQILNKYMHWWGHEFIYDEEELSLLFSETGFRKNSQAQWRVSSHSELNGLEFRPDNDDNIFEGTK